MGIEDIYFVQARSTPTRNEDTFTAQWHAWQTLSQESDYELAYAMVEILNGTTGTRGRVYRAEDFADHEDELVRAVREAKSSSGDTHLEELRTRARERFRV